MSWRGTLRVRRQTLTVKSTSGAKSEHNRAVLGVTKNLLKPTKNLKRRTIVALPRYRTRCTTGSWVPAIRKKKRNCRWYSATDDWRGNTSVRSRCADISTLEYRIILRCGHGESTSTTVSERSARIRSDLSIPRGGLIEEHVRWTPSTRRPDGWHDSLNFVKSMVP